MGSKNHGRPFRLPKYDYSQNGCYFVTFCTKGRLPLLSRVTVGRGACPRQSLRSIGGIDTNRCAAGRADLRSGAPLSASCGAFRYYAEPLSPFDHAAGGKPPAHNGSATHVVRGRRHVEVSDNAPCKAIERDAGPCPFPSVLPRPCRARRSRLPLALGLHRRQPGDMGRGRILL